MTKTPKGVIAIVVDEKGNVIATHADFNNSGFGGFKLYESQSIRASDHAKALAIRSFVGPRFADYLGSYAQDTIWSDLRKYWKIQLRGVGYDDDDETCELIRKKGD